MNESVGSRVLLAGALQQVLIGLGLLLLASSARALVPVFEARHLFLPLPSRYLLTGTRSALKALGAVAVILLALRARRAWIAGIALLLICQVGYCLALGAVAMTVVLPLMQLLTQY